MVTPQTNTTLQEIAEQLKLLDDFVICGHVNPDGDCLGSQLGLYYSLTNMGKNVTCLLARNEPIDYGLRFLPGVDSMIPACNFDDSFSVFICVDVPTPERIGDAAPIQKQAHNTFTIDHHAVDTRMSQFTYVDPDSPAAALLVWELSGYLNARSYEVAQCCLTGLITDTGRFAYQNTTPEAFSAAAEMMKWGASPSQINKEFFQNRSLASLKLEQIVLDRMSFFADGKFVVSYLMKKDFHACNAIKADSEALIDTLRSVRGVKVALILRENNNEEIRGSLRAKDNETNVAAVAKSFDGGGHKAAAGFTYHGKMDQAFKDVTRKVLSHCFNQTLTQDEISAICNCAALDVSLQNDQGEVHG